MGKITFVIPAFGESPYLKDCIQSLRSQTISVDIQITTSTPNSHIESIAKEFELPLKKNSQRSSIADDWNFALQSASDSELIVLAHQDDFYLETFAQEVVEFQKRYNNVGIIFSDCYEQIGSKLTQSNKREIVKKVLRRVAFFGANTVNSPWRYRLLLGLGCPIPCPSVVFIPKVLRNFQFDRGFTVNLDWAAWTELAQLQYPIGYIRKPLMIHRIHEQAQTQIAIGDSSRANEDLQMFSRYWPKFIARFLCKIYQLGYK